MKLNLSLTVLAALSLLLTSCKSKYNIDYMQNIENVAIQASQNSSYTIQPGDQLVINVSAKDMDVVKPFNQNYSSGEVSQFTLPSSNLPVQSQTSVSGPTYIVDSKGNFDFPVLGEINTTGKTAENLQDELKEKLTKFIKNPGVNIRNNNFKVTILGEVNKPGQYMIPDGQPATILAALGLAGDLTIYGERDKILVVRNINGTTDKQYINILDANFINSPYYYIKQNDVIYVTPNNTRKNSSSFGPQTNILISVASIIVGVLAIIVR